MGSIEEREKLKSILNKLCIVFFKRMEKEREVRGARPWPQTLVSPNIQGWIISVEKLNDLSLSNAYLNPLRPVGVLSSGPVSDWVVQCMMFPSNVPPLSICAGEVCIDRSGVWRPRILEESSFVSETESTLKCRVQDIVGPGIWKRWIEIICCLWKGGGTCLGFYSRWETEK